MGEGIEDKMQFSLLSSSLHNSGVIHMTVATGAILFPTLLDNLLDLWQLGCHPGRLERTIFIAAFFSAALIEYISYYTRLTTIINCCAFSGELWILVSIPLMSLHRIHPVFSLLRVSFILILTYVFVFTSLWSVVYNDHMTLQIALVFKYFALGALFLLVAFYLYSVYRQPNHQNQVDMQTGLLTSVSLVTTLVVYIILVAVFDSSSGYLNASVNALYGIRSLSLLCFLCLTLFPQRVSKFEAARTEMNLELKRTFIRYISHELRNPISIILDCIDLAEEQINEGASREEIKTILSDMKLPCRTGMEVLNELLDFEKMDSGLTTIDKSIQDPCLFIESTLHPFALVARRKDIQFSISNSITGCTLQVDVDETKVIVLGRLTTLMTYL